MMHIQRLVDIYIRKGYHGKIPKDIPTSLLEHVMYFRACLDAYDELIQHKIYSKEELYFRCLNEGVSFTEEIKKTRNFSLQSKICIDENYGPAEYTVDSYSGYDSILHERYLINWDDSKETIDWPYSLIEPEKEIEVDMTIRGISKLITRYKLEKCKNEIITLFEPVANKKSMTLDGDKTTLLKNTWDPSLRGGAYMAVRKVVPTFTGSTRDTGVPDVESLCKLKLLHQHTRQICEKLPYSANCDFATMNQRIARLRRKMYFLHIDFKKFGLTFPRSRLNTILEVFDLGHLKIDEFILRTEDGDIKTNRGGVLGWFDATVSLATIAILTHLAEQQGWMDFDMLQFNDDIEIGFGDIPIYEIKYRKDLILRTLVEHGFIMSYRKVFASEQSIFLEDYWGFHNLDMTKMQLAVNFFAKSLCTQFRWEAKICYAMGRNYGYTTNLFRMCTENIEIRRDNELSKPVELGGWIMLGSEGLNTALEDASPSEMCYFIKMKKYKEPHIMPKRIEVDLGKLLRKKESAVYNSTKPVNYYKERIKYDEDLRLSQEERHATEVMRGFVLPEAQLPKLPKRPLRPKTANYDIT